ncbi:MAG: hypothetical protein KatS3mg051_1289 [Anaerolineae bacterium]|nr:MAG: hypothetical protein KatS3mg051_1289 [Anaerolineae bacterium]
MPDLIALVADSNMEYTLRGLLSRHEALGIRRITYDIVRHEKRDPGCWTDAHNFLRPYVNQYPYALVMFDHQGSGQESREITELEDELEARLQQNGWAEGRARVIVLEPELEIWVWSDSPQVDQCLGWQTHQPDLRTWLREHNLLAPGKIKPTDPKKALEAALREVKTPRSSAIYKQLAEQVSFQRCVDPCFKRLRTILTDWFSEAPSLR